MKYHHTDSQLENIARPWKSTIAGRTRPRRDVSISRPILHSHYPCSRIPLVRGSMISLMTHPHAKSAILVIVRAVRSGCVNYAFGTDVSARTHNTPACMGDVSKTSLQISCLSSARQGSHSPLQDCHQQRFQLYGKLHAPTSMALPLIDGSFGLLDFQHRLGMVRDSPTYLGLKSLISTG